MAQDSGRKRGRRRAEAALAEAGDAPPRRRGVSRVLIWFVFVFIVAALVLGGYRYRNDIVRVWPPAMRLYEVLRIDVEPPTGFGLRVPQDSIKFRRESEGGVPILVVSGEVVNASKKPQRMAPMRVVLMDKQNLPLRTEHVKLDDRIVEPDQRAPFKVSIANPPPEAVSVRITFDMTGG